MLKISYCSLNETHTVVLSPWCWYHIDTRTSATTRYLPTSSISEIGHIITRQGVSSVIFKDWVILQDWSSGCINGSPWWPQNSHTSRHKAPMFKNTKTIQIYAWSFNICPSKWENRFMQMSNVKKTNECNHQCLWWDHHVCSLCSRGWVKLSWKYVSALNA